MEARHDLKRLVGIVLVEERLQCVDAHERDIGLLLDEEAGVLEATLGVHLAGRDLRADGLVVAMEHRVTLALGAGREGQVALRGWRSRGFRLAHRRERVLPRQHGQESSDGKGDESLLHGTDTFLCCVGCDQRPKSLPCLGAEAGTAGVATEDCSACG